MKRIALAALLAGCSHAQVDVGAGSPHGGLQAHIHGGHELALAFGVALIAAGIYETERTGGISSTRAVPELDPSRRVSEQDCTKPLDYTLGNIRCK